MHVALVRGIQPPHKGQTLETVSDVQNNFHFEILLLNFISKWDACVRSQHHGMFLGTGRPLHPN